MLKNAEIELANLQTVRYTVCVIHHTTHRLMPNEPDLFESLRLELRRGSLILAVLAELRVERYGYTLRQALGDLGLDIEEGTLYPLLRRLEAQGLLTSEWREEERRNKRFYRLSVQGRTMLGRLVVEWRGLNASLDRIL